MVGHSRGAWRFVSTKDTKEAHRVSSEWESGARIGEVGTPKHAFIAQRLRATGIFWYDLLRNGCAFWRNGNQRKGRL